MTQYPCLWFNNEAQEAAEFYCSVFRDSKMGSVNPVVARFNVAGQSFMCLNGGPLFSRNPTISFYTVCETEEEVDSYWSQLAEGGFVMMPLSSYPWSKKYGWVQDRYGTSWQLTLGEIGEVGQKITPMLMFCGKADGKAGEAVDFYLSVFHPSSLVMREYYAQGQGPEGHVVHSRFLLDKSLYMAMDSHVSHEFNFNEGMSLVVECDNQQQIDHLWSKLSEGGEEQMCGWLKDRYGVSWQIVPTVLGQLMGDAERSQRVMAAFMKMRKFDIAALLEA
jgi:predicted 3-demethylubiquinone-9 3-methyltransferase (glyoxalase superfamily)